MTKYYLVLKSNPIWLKGAILNFKDDFGTEGGYKALEDKWDATDCERSFYMTKCIVEKNPEWFERVYKSKTDKFLSKAEAMLYFEKDMLE